MISHDPSGLDPRSRAAATPRPLAEGAALFERTVPPLGRFRLRALRIPEDIPIVHDWVNREYAKFWGLGGQSCAQVAAAYAEIVLSSQVVLGFRGEEPVFLLETYHPSRDAVGQHYPVRAGDRGMHILVAPAERPVPGFTWSVFRLVMDFLFSDAATDRIVVEPDVHNGKIHALNLRAGFRYQKLIDLPNKTAHLAFCTRAQYRAALERERLETQRSEQRDASAAGASPQSWIAHLEPSVWSHVNQALVRKAIAELAHERVLCPRRLGGDGEWGDYVLAGDQPEHEYRFRARVLGLEHWDIERGSVEKTVAQSPGRLDALDFILELRKQLHIDPAMLPTYLEEIASTLYAAAYKHAHQQLGAADLVHAGFQEIEAAMAEGHPSFIANSGRIGFDAADYVAYSPEAAAPIRLVWLAAHEQCTEITTAAGLSYQRLIREELDAGTLAAHDHELRQRGLDPSNYLLMPVHPWQWFNKLATLFAPDLAERALVCLGFGDDTYRAQQSIRTFFNVSHPHKRYVKTALSVLNMGFMRGLSADYMRSTPPINDWIGELMEQDAFFDKHGFGILREVAAVGYRNRRLEGAVPKHSAYRKMLAALWRESPVPKLAPGQRLMTMAALLHRDRDGVALLPQLIRASGVSVDVWLERYLYVYLEPLVHCLYRYGLAFMPHGENVILVLEGNVVVRAFLKDIAEEAVIMDPASVVPERVQRICVSVPEELKALSIFTDVFDGIFRHLAVVLVEQAGYSEARFWRRVADSLLAYRRAHPESAAAMERCDLFAPEFRHSCLNRLQLRNNQQMIDLADPTRDLQFAGTLTNPIAKFLDAPSSRQPGAPTEIRSKEP